MLKFIKSLLINILGFVKQRPTVKRLRNWGAVIGEDVELYSVTCSRIDATCLEIGSHVTLTGVHILTHDASTKRFLGNDINRIGRVVIGDNVFIGRHTVVLPNVKIGNNVVVGAGSVVTKSIPDNVIAAGNPCRIICSIEEWIEKQKKNMQSNTFWNVKRDALSKEKRDLFNKQIDGRIVYLGKK